MLFVNNNTRPHPSHLNTEQNQADDQSQQTELRHYPIMRNMQDVNVRRQAAMVNHRTPLTSRLNGGEHMPQRTPDAMPYSLQPPKPARPRGFNRGPQRGGNAIEPNGRPYMSRQGRAANAAGNPMMGVNPMGGQMPEQPPNPIDSQRAKLLANLLANPMGTPPPPAPGQMRNSTAPSNMMPAAAPEPYHNESAQAQLSPREAAEQFQRVNRGLPDGVQYEPLDDQTMQLLKSMGKLPDAPSAPASLPPAAAAVSPDAFAAKAPAQPSLDTSAASGFVSDCLTRLMQDERNAHIFYGYLSRTAPREDIRKSLAGVAETCRERAGIYGSLLERLYGKSFTPVEKAINTRVSFGEGIEMARAEEYKTLRTLSELVEKIDDDAAAKTIQHIINRKMVDQNMFQFINTDMFSRFI